MADKRVKFIEDEESRTRYDMVEAWMKAWAQAAGFTMNELQLEFHEDGFTMTVPSDSIDSVMNQIEQFGFLVATVKNVVRRDDKQDD